MNYVVFLSWTHKKFLGEAKWALKCVEFRAGGFTCPMSHSTGLHPALLIVSMYMWGCLCICGHVEIRGQPQMHLSATALPVFFQTWPGPHSVGLAGWPVTSWMSLSLPPYCWGYRSVPLCSAFKSGLPPCLHTKHFTEKIHYPALCTLY